MIESNDNRQIVKIMYTIMYFLAEELNRVDRF